MSRLMNTIKTRNESNWEEVYTKSTLKWYKLAKYSTEVARNVWWVQGQERMRLLFKLRTGSAGLLKDKKRCRMVIDVR